jgi:hypothetical protein
MAGSPYNWQSTAIFPNDYVREHRGCQAVSDRAPATAGAVAFCPRARPTCVWIQRFNTQMVWHGRCPPKIEEKAIMFKVTTMTNQTQRLLALEGSLVSPWLSNLRREAGPKTCHSAVTPHGRVDCGHIALPGRTVRGVNSGTTNEGGRCAPSTLSTLVSSARPSRL